MTELNCHKQVALFSRHKPRPPQLNITSAKNCPSLSRYWELNHYICKTRFGMQGLLAVNHNLGSTCLISCNERT